MGRRLLISFRYALMGIARTVSTQRNMKVHILCALLVSLFGMAVPLDLATRSALMIAIALVFFAEILNTALEAIVDLYTGEYHRLAMLAKDAAAGGVLILASITVLIFADIVYMRFYMIMASFDNVLFFAAYGGILVVLEALGLWVLKSHMSNWLRLAGSIALMVLLWDKSKDPCFALLALLLIAMSTYSMYAYPNDPIHAK